MPAKPMYQPDEGDKRKCSPEFYTAFEKVRNIKSGATNDELLTLYGLNKVARSQELPASRPGAFAFQAKYSYDKFKGYVDEGKKPEDAEKEYIQFANEMIGRLPQKSA